MRVHDQWLVPVSAMQQLIKLSTDMYIFGSEGNADQLAHVKREDLFKHNEW